MFLLLFTLILTAQIAYGSPVQEKTVSFETNTLLGKCRGTVNYPELFSGENAPELATINSQIKEFASEFIFCKPVSRANPTNQYSTSYEIASSTDKYLSIKWLTKIGGQIIRIDCLTFDMASGELLEVDDFLSILAKNFMPEISKLSHGHLSVEVKWEQFLAKIASRDIQFYFKDRNWYIVFNQDPHMPHDVVIAKLPSYFIKDKETE